MSKYMKGIKNAEDKEEEEFVDGQAIVKAKKSSRVIHREKNGCVDCNSHPKVVLAECGEYIGRVRQCCKDCWKNVDDKMKKNTKVFRIEAYDYADEEIWR